MRTTTTFGAPGPGCGRVGNDGVDSASVRPMTPSNGSCLGMAPPPLVRRVRRDERVDDVDELGGRVFLDEMVRRFEHDVRLALRAWDDCLQFAMCSGLR